MLYSLVAMLVVILDQAVKFWVTNTIMGYDMVTAIPGVLSLVCVPNDGAAFSILSGGGARIYFIIVTVVFCIGVILALATNFVNGKLARWSLVMVAAGGFANCIDRVIYGYVIDMFKVDLFSGAFNFPIFNVADIFITVFAIIFAICIIFERKPKDEDEDEDDEDDEDEDDYEQERPAKAKKPLFARFHKDDDDEDEEEERRPSRGKKAQYEDEYKEYKAQQRTSRASQPQVRPDSRPQQRPAAQSRDPFAEWDRAKAQADAKRGDSYAARAMGGQRPAQPGQRPQQAQPMQHPAPAQQAKPVQRPVQPAQQPPVQRPAAAPAPAPAPDPQAAAKPASKPAGSSSEFDLDDILNEFR